jgi:hypothetical protein
MLLDDDAQYRPPDIGLLRLHVPPLFFLLFFFSLRGYFYSGFQASTLPNIIFCLSFLIELSFSLHCTIVLNYLNKQQQEYVEDQIMHALFSFCQ